MNSFSFKKILEWLDNYGLVVLAGFLIAFIPLYPKIPFWSPIEQYNVRVRLEDFFILLTAILWGIQWLRGRIRWRTPITWTIFAYLAVGGLSVLSALFVINSVPLQPLHVGKTLLHYFRYFEYFSLFFIAYSAITSKKQIQYLLGILTLTVVATAIYGYGQKYYYWPVYSTMNREFSKGVRLYLTEHARVQSTFAGHYDLGAYLVIALPIILALAFYAKNKVVKVLLHLAHWSGAWLLVMSASRTSFAAYLGAVGLVLLIMGIRQATWWQRFTWTSTRSLMIGLVLAITMLTWGEDMYDRFLQVLEGYPVMYNNYHAFNGTRKKVVNEYLPAMVGLREWPKPPSAQIPENAISTDDAARILVNSDQRPVKDKPSDVYVNVPDYVEVEVATESASGAAETITIIEERDRVYSDCSKKRGLSLCIRLETLWPQAINGFMRNPLLGSGYATLNKTAIDQFTEADSTDNNFLRTLGETGILGVITFYGVVVLALYYAVLGVMSKDKLLNTFAIGFIAGTAGLLLNAVYIDVFASSKVALTYWCLTGILMAYLTITQRESQGSSSTNTDLAMAFSKIQKPVSGSTSSSRRSSKKKTTKKSKAK